MRLAVVYGSTYGDTADAAERIAGAFERLAGLRPPLFDVGATDLGELAAYDALLIGCSTWHGGELQTDWEAKLGELARLELRGKLVALFGAGDRATPRAFRTRWGVWRTFYCEFHNQ